MKFISKQKLEKLAVLIPCYNEGKTIATVINSFKKNFKGVNIYVYDNNSSDDTAAIAKRNGALVRSESRQGKGNVVRSMLRDINAKYYILVDGDNAFDAKEAKKIYESVKDDNYDLIIGDRLSSNYYKDQKRLFHGVGNKLVKFVVNLIFNSKINDIMSGFRILSFEFAKTFPVLSNGFELETEMSIHAAEKKLRVLNYPVTFKERPSGSISSMNTFIDGMKVMSTVFTLFMTYKPFIFYTILSLILFVVSLSIFIPVYIYWLDNASVPNFPRLIVSGFIMVISIILFAIGLILQVIVKKNKQDFEVEYNKLSMFKRMM